MVLLSGFDWMSQYTERVVPYVQFIPPEDKTTLLRSSDSVLGVHLEENYLSYVTEEKLMMRHAETAGYAFYYEAGLITERSLPVYVIDANPFVGGVLQSPYGTDLDKRITRDILRQVDVISLSMNTDSNHRVSISKDFIEDYWVSWDESEAIVTQSAGNNGKNCHKHNPRPTDQQEFAHYQYADTYIKVAEAQRALDNKVVVKASSQCNGPDVSVLNPYLEGLRFRFRPTLEEYISSLAKYINPPLSESHQDSLVKKLMEKRQKDVDEEGFMTNIGGTSFSSPALGGYLLGVKYICPELSSFDLVAGVFSYAYPVDSEGGMPILYKSNGVLPYDDVKGGFGFLDRNVYKDRMLKQCGLLRINPHYKTVKDNRSFRFDSLEAFLDGDKKTVYFEVKEDVLIFRTIFTLTAKESGVPFTMEVTSPKGRSIRLNPANSNLGGDSWAVASTNGFFGNSSKGQWKITFYKYKNIDSIDLKISGVKPGGLVERII
ncbi:MAG: S8 family serine peptidase, partial [Bdellovibrionales bacterium]|nr:S8 family serine peptidase [Bdellovibrionales bacterium]